MSNDNNNIQTIMSLVDENKDDMPEGLYLQMANLLKKHYDKKTNKKSFYKIYYRVFHVGINYKISEGQHYMIYNRKRSSIFELEHKMFIDIKNRLDDVNGRDIDSDSLAVLTNQKVSLRSNYEDTKLKINCIAKYPVCIKCDSDVACHCENTLVDTYTQVNINKSYLVYKIEKLNDVDSDSDSDSDSE